MGQNGRYGRLDQRDFNQTRGMSNNQEQRVQSKAADNARSLDTRSSNATSHENADGSHGVDTKGKENGGQIPGWGGGIAKTSFIQSL